jgi:hypothetical protein
MQQPEAAPELAADSGSPGDRTGTTYDRSSTPESWAPYLSSTSGAYTLAGAQLDIHCYLTGDSVTGPYGTENIWD